MSSSKALLACRDSLTAIRDIEWDLSDREWWPKVALQGALTDEQAEEYVLAMWPHVVRTSYNAVSDLTVLVKARRPDWSVTGQSS